MNPVLMLAAAAAALQPCPPVRVMEQSTPVALRIHGKLPKKLVDWEIKLDPKEVLASTDYFLVDGVPTSFHVIRSPGIPGRTRIFALCLAPWGEMMCARKYVSTPGPSPDVFIRQQSGKLFMVIRRQQNGRKLYEGWTLDQLTGLREVCGS